ncbi:D111/G-patch protein [Moelleriella libera RCEF 2490]|uniref:D111/G-patch protein n=1 Tax=Moelleriella libera RCEF 2490 TaxID=1081109 RepID=A0A166V818_9HYPO|nr:D111/G-patch protein [Moelleriella libera RCEF 2490]
MAAPQPPPPPKAAFSLYGNLQDPNDPPASATISSAPVMYNQGGSTDIKRSQDPALRFQPIRRPPVKQPKTKATFPKAITTSKTLGTVEVPSSSSAGLGSATAATAAPPTKSSLADWAATEADEWRYGVGEKRQRGGRKKKKRPQHMPAETDWDEIYDPARPTNVEEYLKSDEKINEVREWKALLYRHRKSKEDNRFAPPPSYASVPPPPKSPLAAPPPEETADEAYARRMALFANRLPASASASPAPSPLPLPPPPPPAAAAAIPPPPPLHPPPLHPPPLHPPPLHHPPHHHHQPPSSEPNPASIPALSSDSATISRAPIRYSQPSESQSPPPMLGGAGESSGSIFNNNNDNMDDGESDGSQQRSRLPGQAGFAQRLMGKYGWTKGSGLGANESGIVNPLRVQMEKRRKKADADGGGWAEPGGKGRIIGSKRKQEESGRFGTMSDVIVLRNMLENMPDLAAEIEDGLGQEIGEECGEKYGRVERLYIDQSSRQVFIKFTNQVSALRAVNELDGRVFNGNTIAPGFYDANTFDKGIYDKS